MIKLALGFIISAVFSISALGADIIVSAEFTDKNLNQQQLSDIFTRKISHWSNGMPIKVFIKPRFSLEHRDFTFSWLGIGTFSYQEKLNINLKANEVDNVIEVNNDALMLDRVATNPGSIGYLTYITPLTQTKRIRLIKK